MFFFFYHLYQIFQYSYLSKAVHFHFSLVFASFCLIPLSTFLPRYELSHRTRHNTSMQFIEILPLIDSEGELFSLQECVKKVTLYLNQVALGLYKNDD